MFFVLLHYTVTCTIILTCTLYNKTNFMFLIAPMEYNDVDNNSHEWIGDFLENSTPYYKLRKISDIINI